MAVSRALRSLLNVRNLEVDQHKAVLESAMAELHRLEEALAVARERRLNAGISAATSAGDCVDRRALELQAASEARREQLLAVRYTDAKARAEEVREMFVHKRMEQRQAETLIETAKNSAQNESNRRLQRTIDDWHASRRESSGKKTR